MNRYEKILRLGVYVMGATLETFLKKLPGVEVSFKESTGIDKSTFEISKNDFVGASTRSLSVAPKIDKFFSQEEGTFVTVSVAAATEILKVIGGSDLDAKGLETVAKQFIETSYHEQENLEMAITKLQTVIDDEITRCKMEKEFNSGLPN